MNLTRTRLLRIGVAAAAVTTAAVCLEGGLGPGDLLCMAPALALAASLLVRRYPGERLLLRIAGRCGGRRRAPSPRVRAAHPRVAGFPRGGLLMGFALAVRPPPAEALAG